MVLQRCCKRILCASECPKCMEYHKWERFCIFNDGCQNLGSRTWLTAAMTTVRLIWFMIDHLCLLSDRQMYYAADLHLSCHKICHFFLSCWDGHLPLLFMHTPSPTPFEQMAIKPHCFCLMCSWVGGGGGEEDHGLRLDGQWIITMQIFLALYLCTVEISMRFPPSRPADIPIFQPLPWTWPWGNPWAWLFKGTIRAFFRPSIVLVHL